MDVLLSRTIENADAGVSESSRSAVIADHRRGREAFGIEEGIQPVLHPSWRDQVGARAPPRHLGTFRSNAVHIVGVGLQDGQRNTRLEGRDAPYRPVAHQASAQTILACR